MTLDQEIPQKEIKVYQYNLPLHIDPANMALIVVDMQNDFIHPDGILPKKSFGVADLDLFVERMSTLINACRAKGMPVIATRHIIKENDKGQAIGGGLWAEMRPFLKHEGFRLGTWGAELIEGLPVPDHVIDKPRFSAFYETGLYCLLRGIEAETLIFAGVATNVCVESTIRDAFFRDFNIITVENCTAAYSREAHNASLVTLRFLGAVISLNELQGLLEERRI